MASTYNIAQMVLVDIWDLILDQTLEKMEQICKVIDGILEENPEAVFEAETDVEEVWLSVIAPAEDFHFEICEQWMLIGILTSCSSIELNCNAAQEVQVCFSVAI